MSRATFHDIGVIGAGTMGSGIALAAVRAGLSVYLYDISADMLNKAREYILHHLRRKGQESLADHLHLTGDLQALSRVQAVIEAAPENLELKLKLFADISSICPPPAVLASNTSTLSITRLAAGAHAPERVVGMHFFNPAPVMPLVEVIRGAQTSDGTIDSAVALARALGKTPVVATDTPGFIVNRIARPFYGEALRLLAEGVATHEELDWILEGSGGFRMGPFKLMDLIGIDINFTAMKSVYEQTFGEPRFRPSLLQQQKIQENALGRKTGRGFYVYGEDQGPAATPQAPQPSDRPLTILLSSAKRAPGLEAYLVSRGHTLVREPEKTAEAAFLVCSRDENLLQQAVHWDTHLPEHLPIFCQCVDITLSEVLSQVRNVQRWFGLDSLFLTNGHVATLVNNPQAGPEEKQKAEAVFRHLGFHPIWIREAPALVVPRIVSMLINEAAFAALEGVADEATIDTAMKLGVNYPRGLFEWAQQIGVGTVVAVLDHLYQEYHEERYRACVLLRRQSRLQRFS